MTEAIFADLSQYIAAPRVNALTLSTDGTRLVAAVAELDDERARYRSSLWEIPLEDGEPTRLTRSGEGESAPRFHPDGSVLFVSSRPDGPSDKTNDEAALWRLPVRGEAEPVASWPGGLGNPVVARSGRVLMGGSKFIGPLPADADVADDAAARELRTKRKVSAVLHTGMPIRYWDHELGWQSPRLLAWNGDGDGSDGAQPRDVLPDAVHELTEATWSVSADGTRTATTWQTRLPHGMSQQGVAILDLDSGEHSMWPQEPDEEFEQPVLSPDGMRVAVLHRYIGNPDEPFVAGARVYDVDGSNPVVLDLGDLYPNELAWSPDGTLLFVAGDWHGRAPVVVIDPASGAVLRRLASDAAYTALCPAPDNESVFALRSSPAQPPHPVRLDVSATDQTPTPLPAPGTPLTLPGALHEVEVEVGGNLSCRGWLCLPDDASDVPAPLMLWVHGGPFMSSNSWSWRWNPWVAVARGYAVLMPDPSLSTGYGQEWIARAWPHRAAPVWRDLELLLDVVTERPDIDGERVACLGGSFGGYMTNWIAGHTDRFRAIVTHAGLWALDQQHTTTDWAAGKLHMIGTPADRPEWYAENSPHNFISEIRTPMLVCHGNRDYRVPISEALRLWWDLVSTYPGEPDTMPHRFLNLTDENHWVLKPANVQIWYETVLDFCDTHVRG